MILRRRWGEGEGRRKSGEKEVLSLRSVISTCPRLDVNTNTNRKSFKVAPFVHNALAVGCSLFRRWSWSRKRGERGRREQTISGSRAVAFALGDDQIEAPPPDGRQLNRVENSSALPFHHSPSLRFRPLRLISDLHPHRVFSIWNCVTIVVGHDGLIDAGVSGEGLAWLAHWIFRNSRE